MAPFDGPTWHQAPVPPAEAVAEAGESAWECADCGWTAHPSQLAAGRTMRNAIETHERQYCARPPF